jgi:hypothetical protein
VKYVERKQFEYDVAISFAGEDREIAEALASRLHQLGAVVFYDRFSKAALWGKNLVEHLAEVYESKSRFCLMIVSRHYPLKEWPRHERRSAQDRQLREPQEYILPLRLDMTRIPGLPSTVAYLDWKSETVESICRLVMEKLGAVSLPQDQVSPAQMDDRIGVLAGRLTDWAASRTQKLKALKELGLMVREGNAVGHEGLTHAVVVALFSSEKTLREIASAILIEIGPPAIPVILEKQLWKIPGKQHGYDAAKEIFVAMGARAVETLVNNIDKDVYIVTGALTAMPFDDVKDACKQLFRREQFVRRYREEIVRKMRSATWNKSELKELLSIGINHADPLVRVLSAEWLIADMPEESALVLMLTSDTAPVEKFYGPTQSKAVRDWVASLLTPIPNG